MKIRVKYRRARVLVKYKKQNFCQACGRKGRTEMHHYYYKYKTNEVRKKPMLAIENTTELCYGCHRIADHIRNLVSDSNRFRLVYNVLLKKLKEKRRC